MLLKAIITGDLGVRLRFGDKNAVTRLTQHPLLDQRCHIKSKIQPFFTYKFSKDWEAGAIRRKRPTKWLYHDNTSSLTSIAKQTWLEEKKTTSLPASLLTGFIPIGFLTLTQDQNRPQR
ncbi:hypothetical protein TNCV_2756731 [Trichonephila clavipes]|nr:hypothetical protein TNCV_2756731 [Trichonephila clavipes]